MAVAGSLSATPVALAGTFKSPANHKVQQPNSCAHHVDRSGKGKLVRPESKRLLERLEQQETLFRRDARIAQKTRMRGFRAAGLGHPTLDNKSRGMRSVIVKATIQEKDQEQKEKDPKPDAEETTRKLGLEAGLWQIFTSKDESKEDSKESRTSQAKGLLARYGGAYLVTSISLSVISFGLCYVLVSNGVDVAALLQKVGIQSNETGEKVGTFALAYAAHKAASPIRFPPTVALTPIVAGWFGKKPADVTEEDKV